MTKGKDCSIIAKPSRKGGTQSRDWSIGTKKTSKKLEKSLKKVLTKAKGCGIITKLAARAESATVLEN